MTPVEIRRATRDDRPSVLALLRATLGWGDDARYEELFAWKHDANPFGPSPGWVALDEDRVVGFRTFMRWEFQLDGQVLSAVRAVDTATHPDYQGRGVFRELTLHALAELHAEGVGFVFNTPNHASRRGYLRMGWRDVGRLPVRVRPRGVGATARMLRARVPADRWPLDGPVSAGVAATEALADTTAIEELIAAASAPAGLSTSRTTAYLAWRYGLASLGYRALLLGSDPREGLLLFRLRQRGRALEMAVVDALLRRSNGRVSLPVGRVLRQSGADYAIAIGRAVPGARSLPLPRQGPMLTWRGLSQSAMLSLRCWHLTLGDVELF